MSGDANLQPYAQKSIDFICAAQHPQGGCGTRRGNPATRRLPGWQLMALKKREHVATLRPVARDGEGQGLLGQRPGPRRCTLRLPGLASNHRVPRPSGCSRGCISAGPETTRDWTAASATWPTWGHPPRTCTSTTTRPRCCIIRTATVGRPGYPHAGFSRSDPGAGRARKGELVLSRSARHARRPLVHDCHVHHDSRGLLSLHAAVRQPRGGRRLLRAPNSTRDSISRRPDFRIGRGSC